MAAPARIIPVLFLMMSSVLNTAGGEHQGGKQFVDSVPGAEYDSTSHFFLVSLPPGYGESEGLFPAIFFLHGSGERGTQIGLVKKHGPPKLADEQELPFVIISPQCLSAARWSVTELDDLLGRVLDRYRIDPGRIYLTGLSMGGSGTWEWAAARPERFAAIAPICGGGDTAKIGSLREMPAWVFHGADDNVVPLIRSERMVQKLRTLGNPVKFTVYPETGHDSWTRTYENPALYSWLIGHSKK